MPETESKIYGNAFNLIPELGPVRLRRLLEYFGSFKAAWQGSENELPKAGLNRQIIERITSKKRFIDPESEWEKLIQRKIDVIILGEKNYPSLLAEITNPPPVLYIRGNPDRLNRLAVSIVGTRKMSLYGKQAAQEIAGSISSIGINVVSGLAFGIDAEALSACLAHAGYPIAVLASPLDNASISPKANYNLAQKIIHAGCLLSEYSLGSSIQKQNFPIRNRVIAGLTVATVVVEADEESGALITAHHALEENREVFAVPGSIFSPVSRGTNKLIRQGAHLLSNAGDLIRDLNLDHQEVPAIKIEASEEEQTILGLLVQPIHIDELIRLINKAPSEISAALTLLEMKGRIKNLGGARYVKVR